MLARGYRGMDEIRQTLLKFALGDIDLVRALYRGEMPPTKGRIQAAYQHRIRFLRVLT